VHSERHAEMMVLSAFEASRPAPGYLSHGDDLSAYSLVTTLEPCPMCAARSVLAGVGRVVYVVEDAEGGASRCRGQMPPRFHGANQVWEVARCNPVLRDSAFHMWDESRWRLPSRVPLDLTAVPAEPAALGALVVQRPEVAAALIAGPLRSGGPDGIPVDACVVRGAGDAGADGCYCRVGRLYVRAFNGAWVLRVGEQGWSLCNLRAVEHCVERYIVFSSGGAPPPRHGWSVAAGTAPAPEVEVVGAARHLAEIAESSEVLAILDELALHVAL
jgi:hypothetical protein